MRSISILIHFAMGVMFTAFAYSNTLGQSAGSLDPTFDGDGKVIMQIGSQPPWAEGMATQSDGKIVAAVGLSLENLLRLNADGSLDSTFGTGGIVNFSWATADGTGNVMAVAIQNIEGEERIVVAGYSHIRLGGRKTAAILHVERFMPDGAVDTSFGTNGHAVINTGYASAVAIQPDGKIVTVGVDDGKLVRLNVNGTLDTTFGTGGVVISGSSRALAVDATGRILVGVNTTIGKGNSSRSAVTVKRYNANGGPDTAFGMSGSAIADFGVSVQGWRLAIDPFGNIVVSGTGPGPAAARLTANGLVDTSFNGGRVVFAGLSGAGRGMVMQSDGKVVLTGQSNNDLGLVRYNFDGSLDTSFGSGGSLLVDVYGSDFSDISVLQLDPGCACPKIVVAGGNSPITTFARFVVD
jgi:uncharacterized delta-60 repeat protein